MTAQRPNVNGLSPKLVFPGSKITIRGEHLGTDINDIINLWICGEDCKPFIELHSENKIVCHVGKHPNTEDPYVIIVTRSGGEGDCEMKLQITDRVDRVSQLEEVPIWRDENIFFQMETVVSPTDRALSQSHQQNLFGSRVPFKVTETSSETDPSSNMFDPVRYLLHNHNSITIMDLQQGIDHLSVQCRQHTDSDIEFVKTHIDVLLSCHETLEKVNNCIDEEETHSDGGSLTGPLATVLNECNKCAEQLFSSILSKKDKADRIRNALNVIERFTFLFSLPDSIDKNIDRKEYDIVLNDYKKAKSLFADTQVNVFQQVMNGVHGKIRVFSGDLQTRLMEPRCPLNEKKQLLKYVIEFEGSPTNDPAWLCLQKQQHQVIQYMTASKIDFHGKLLEFVSIAQIKAARGGHTDENISPIINEFIDELCDTVTQSLPDYWSLCQAYLDGSLFPEVKKAVLSQQDSFLSPPTTPFLQRPVQRKGEHEGELHGLIRDVMELLNTIVRQYCLDMELKFNAQKDMDYALQLLNKTKPFWSPISVRRIKVCVERLSSASIPASCLTSSITLVNDLRRMCVKCLFENTERNIRELHTRENWQISHERGHTALPLLFQNIVMSLLSTVKEVMEDVNDTDDSIDDMNTDIQDMFYNVVISFADCLKHLTNIIENVNTETDGTMIKDMPGSNIKTEERLVLILGNCRHTILTIIRTLLDTFKSHGYIGNNYDTIYNKSLERYSTLERSIFDKYVNSKDTFLFGDIAYFLEPTSFPWADCNSPVGVTIFVQELALKLVMAQAELHNIDKELLKSIIGYLLENVTVRVCSTISKIERFCKYGAMQARLDIMACLLLFKHNMTTSCKHTMEDTLGAIPLTGITPEDEAMIQILLDSYRQQNSVILSCLDYKPDNDSQFSPTEELVSHSLTQPACGIQRVTSLRRNERLDRVPSLRNTVLKGHNNSSDSITRRRSQKRLVKAKNVRSPPAQSYL